MGLLGLGGVTVVVETSERRTNWLGSTEHSRKTWMDRWNKDNMVKSMWKLAKVGSLGDPLVPVEPWYDLSSFLWR